MLSIMRNILHKELGDGMNFLTIFHGEFENTLALTGCNLYGWPGMSLKKLNIENNPRIHFCNDQYSNIRFDVDIDGIIIHDIVHYDIAKNISPRLHAPIMFIAHDIMPPHVKVEDQYIINNHYNIGMKVALSEEIKNSWGLDDTIVIQKEDIEQWKKALTSLKKTPYLRMK